MPNGSNQAKKNRLIQNLHKTRKATHTNKQPKIPFLAEVKKDIPLMTAEEAVAGLAELGFAGGRRKLRRKTRKTRRGLSKRKH